MSRCNHHHHEEEENDRQRRDDDQERNRNDEDHRDEDRERHHDCEEHQRHVHEFEGSTDIAERHDDPHNHRFAGVSEEAIPYNGSHIHEIETRTDFFDHYHDIRVFSGPAIHVGNHKHVHYVTGRTTREDGHTHEFRFATLIESPTFEEREER